MSKFIFFPLWEIESLEKHLEEAEQSGNRLTNVKFSYWFTFKESKPKKMNYFLSYKSFRGQSMGWCDYALESEHKAHTVDTEHCYFSLFRTNDDKDNLSTLYEIRCEYIKRILLEKALTTLFVSLMFLFIFFAAIKTYAEFKSTILVFLFAVISICFAIYYFYGYFKQKKLIKKRHGTVRCLDNRAGKRK